jgi:hypothetical protein
MTSEEVNVNVAYRHAIGQELSDHLARQVAGYWHDGQWTAFYAFASSGHYDRTGLLRELSDTIADCYATAADEDRLQLDMLGTYFVNRDATDGPWDGSSEDDDDA